MDNRNRPESTIKRLNTDRERRLRAEAKRREARRRRFEAARKRREGKPAKRKPPKS